MSDMHEFPRSVLLQTRRVRPHRCGPCDRNARARAAHFGNVNLMQMMNSWNEWLPYDGTVRGIVGMIKLRNHTEQS
jgi:hypothetical protein